MNLIAHAASAGSHVEDQFMAEIFAWVLHAAGGAAQHDSVVTWQADDQARLVLSPSSAPTWVLFKESYGPGWSAELEWPDSPGVHSGNRAIPLLQAEADLVLARLVSVPPGSALVFTYGPTAFEQVAGLLSLGSLAGLFAWLVRPALIHRARRLVVGSTRTLLRVVFGRLARRLSRFGADP
jgi:hypothetical protein